MQKYSTSETRDAVSHSHLSRIRKTNSPAGRPTTLAPPPAPAPPRPAIPPPTPIRRRLRKLADARDTPPSAPTPIALPPRPPPPVTDGRGMVKQSTTGLTDSPGPPPSPPEGAEPPLAHTQMKGGVRPRVLSAPRAPLSTPPSPRPLVDAVASPRRQAQTKRCPRVLSATRALLSTSAVASPPCRRRRRLSPPSTPRPSPRPLVDAAVASPPSSTGPLYGVDLSDVLLRGLGGGGTATASSVSEQTAAAAAAESESAAPSAAAATTRTRAAVTRRDEVVIDLSYDAGPTANATNNWRATGALRTERWKAVMEYNYCSVADPRLGQVRETVRNGHPPVRKVRLQPESETAVRKQSESETAVRKVRLMSESETDVRK